MRWLIAVALFFGQPLFAQVDIVETGKAGSITLIGGADVSGVFVDPADDSAVQRAAANLRTDLVRVAATPSQPGTATRIIVGTIGQSSIIDALIATDRLDVTGVAGRWEASVQQVVEAPMPGVERALVIAGADRRGTVFGIYDLSARIGVSPWH
jgi:hypothetical protein